MCINTPFLIRYHRTNKDCKFFTIFHINIVSSWYNKLDIKQLFRISESLSSFFVIWKQAAMIFYSLFLRI